MKLSKKFMSIAIISMLAIMLLSACGVAKDDKANGESDNKDGGKTITFGVKNDTRLFGLKDPSTGKVEGFDIDMANELAKRMYGDDVKVNLKEVTSKTRIPMLQNGSIDAIIATMTITDERKKEVDFTDVYFKAGQSLLVKKGSKIKSIKDLNKDTTVLAVKGSTSTTNIRAKAKDAPVLEFENYAEAFTALKAGKGDALTTDDAILYGMADEDPKYHLVGGQFTDEPYGIAVKKGNKDLQEKLNKALKEMKDDGTYDEIHDKWIKKDLSSEG
ncbi:transporter substrate-binding domain-containing protein [Bacillus sp. 1P06AnD]|uniref:transporter substrate-binding domain-containing protein n=1 Tax=Bacillus sp. 1P06AnD TaxID=3132208 RepID=UPI00399F5992